MVAAASVANTGLLRRRTPAAGSPGGSPTGSTLVELSPRNIQVHVHVPHGIGSPLASTATLGDETATRRRRSWCHIGVFALLSLPAIAFVLAFGHGRPSGGGTFSSSTSSSHDPHGKYRRRRRRQQQQQQQQQQQERQGTTTSRADEWNYSTRFPPFGTPEHHQMCGGDTTHANAAVPRKEEETPPSSEPCAVLVRPDPDGTEGLALWAANVVMGFFIHRQMAGGTCNLYIDFGPGVNFGAALTSTSAQVPPKGFVCRIEENCHSTWTEPNGSAYRYRYAYHPFPGSNDFTAASAGEKTKRKEPHNMEPRQNHKQQQQQQQKQLAAVPFYRFAYNPRYEKLKSDDFRELQTLLLRQNGERGGAPQSSFNVHTGFACAFSSLFQLSPEAVRYEKKLFTHLLPTLRDPNNLVLGIYVRTGATEGKTSAGAGYEVVEDAEAHIAAATEILDCARKQEALYVQLLGGEESGASRQPQRRINKIVWMLVTDSHYLKEYVSTEYDGMDVVMPDRGRDDATDGPITSTPRVVLTTSSTGAHTRPKGAGSSHESDGSIDAQRTEAFVSAVIDWFLLGETDVSYDTFPSGAHTRRLDTHAPASDIYCTVPY